MVTPIAVKLNSTASGRPRRLFYWLSMVVVLLIAAVTVMEAFGVYYFPHRSWSEGINPSVIQTRGGAVYYTYLFIAPSDLRFELPDEVRPMFLGVLADIKRTDARGKFFLRLMTLPEDLVLLALVWLVRGMILSA